MSGADTLIAHLAPALAGFAAALVGGLLVPALGFVILAGFTKKAADAA